MEDLAELERCCIGLRLDDHKRENLSIVRIRVQMENHACMLARKLNDN